MLKCALPLKIQIGPKEMAGAVREMLSAAGMPVDLERTGLLERSLKLQSQLEAAADRLSQADKVKSNMVFKVGEKL